MTQSSISGIFSTLAIPDEAMSAYKAGKEAAGVDPEKLLRTQP